MKRCIAVLGGIALLSGCAIRPSFDLAKSSELIESNYAAADRLISTVQKPLSKGAPVIVATVVRLENLMRSSNLGRLISEHIASRFTHLGFNVLELRVGNSIFVQSNGGEFILSRDLVNIAASHRAQAIIVGTYAVAGEYVYVNVRLIEAGAHQVIASYNYLLPNIGPIQAMVKEVGER